MRAIDIPSRPILKPENRLDYQASALVSLAKERILKTLGSKVVAMVVWIEGDFQSLASQERGPLEARVLIMPRDALARGVAVLFEWGERIETAFLGRMG